MQTHHTTDAPEAIGPYSQSITTGRWLFTSGQVALDPATGEIVTGGFEAQAQQVMRNLRAVLASADCAFEHVVKSTIYIVDMADFPTLNGIYAEAIGDHRPARSTVQVAALPKGALLEIDMVARKPRTG